METGVQQMRPELRFRCQKLKFTIIFLCELLAPNNRDSSTLKLSSLLSLQVYIIASPQ